MSKSFLAILLLALICYGSCALNFGDIDTVFEEATATDINSGRILFDYPRNRIIVTSIKSVYFIDAGSKKTITIPLTAYGKPSGEFVDEEGNYHAFATKGTAFVRITIDQNGKASNTLVTAFKSISCSVFKDKTRALVLTNDLFKEKISIYDFKNDSIIQHYSLPEAFGGDSCSSDGNTAFFTTPNWIIAADKSDLTKVWTTRINNITLPLTPNIAVDGTNKFVYITFGIQQIALQYNINSREIKHINSEAGLFAGYYGLATHPSSGSVYLFTSPSLKKLDTNAYVLETNNKLYTPNTAEVPNTIMFTGTGRFGKGASRLYVAGYKGKSRNLSVFSIGTTFLWGLSKEAIIGISVGAGVLLLCIISAVLFGLYQFKASRAHGTSGEKTYLIPVEGTRAIA